MIARLSRSTKVSPPAFTPQITPRSTTNTIHDTLTLAIFVALPPSPRWLIVIGGLDLEHWKLSVELTEGTIPFASGSFKLPPFNR